VSSKPTRFSGVLKNTQALAPMPDTTAAEATARKVGRPPGKKSNPEYQQVTIYIEKQVHRTARKLLLDDERQFSDLVNELVSEWVKGKA
jgi:hypothetical protein